MFNLSKATYNSNNINKSVFSFIKKIIFRLNKLAFSINRSKIIRLYQLLTSKSKTKSIDSKPIKSST